MFPTKEFCLEHFLYKDCVLYTTKKWSSRVMLGKTPKRTSINGTIITREELIWIYNKGEIPAGMTVKNGVLTKYSDMVGRPRGSKSSYKRKNTLTTKEEMFLVSEYSLMSQKEIKEKYNISKGQLSSIIEKRKLKKKNLCEYTTGNFSLDDLMGVCGVYGIFRIDNCKAYIGSSNNIGKRLVSHIRDLSSGKHYNKLLQKEWDKNSFYFTIIEECEEKDLLPKENLFLGLLDPYCFYNQSITEDTFLDYSVIWEMVINNSTLTKDGCLEYNSSPLKNGYIWVSYKSKKIQTHRVAFFHKNGYTSNHINHTCCNKKCCNPDHLTEESASGNAKYYHSLLKTGEKSSLYKRRDEIKNLLDAGLSYSKIIKVLNLNISVSALSRFVIKALR